MKKITLFLVVFLILTCFGNVLTGVAFADTASKYTDVLEDLGKDETFDTAQYPASDKDEMDVIQIAESSAGELFLYVYSTTGDKFTASEARISQSIGENLEPKDYKLTLLSRNGTLSKYVVNGLTVKQDTVRYYVVTQLARPWDKDVDKEPPVNTAKTVPYPIGKQFTACTVDGNITYTEKHSDSIEVVSKYVGNLRYYDDGIGIENYTTSHYVAFSTEVKIDKIYEVDISYIELNYSMVPQSDLDSERYKELSNLYLKSTVPCKKTLYSNEYDGNVSKWEILSHTWNTIQTLDSFIASEKLNSDTKKQLEGKQWVLRFAKTDFTVTNMGALMGRVYDFSDVSEVTILRLKFLSLGKVYNLGVIDNKQTGGSVTNPDNGNSKPYEDFLDKLMAFLNWLAENWWVIIVAVVVVVIVVSLFFQLGRQVLGAIFVGIGKLIWWFVKYLGIGLFYVITSPYWIIRAIVLKVREKRGG